MEKNNTLNTKKQWIEKHTLNPGQNKELFECIWRDLVPFDILDSIDYKSLIDLKKTKDLQYEALNQEDIRIFKIVNINGHQYELIISVLDPQEDPFKKDYQFFINITETVNHIPFDIRYIKVVVRTDEFNNMEFKSSMLFENSSEDEKLSLILTKYFENLNYTDLSIYASQLLRNILFNYLCFIKIRHIDKNDKEYNAIDVNGKYFLYKESETDCLICITNQSDASEVIERLVEQIELKGKMLYVVYLNPMGTMITTKDPQIQIVSLEEYFNKIKDIVCLSEGEQSQISKQIHYLNDISNFENINNCENDVYDNNGAIKFLFAYTDEDIIINDDDTQKGVVTYRKKMDRQIKNNEIIQDKEFWKWKDYKIIKREPLETREGWSVCYYYQEKKTRKIISVDNKTCAVKNTLIIPETETTVCNIKESLYNEVENVSKCETKDTEQWDVKKWFNYLCAINVEFAYKKQNNEDANSIVLNTLYDCISKLRKNKTMEFSYYDNNLMVTIEAEYRKYQFSFAVSQKDLKFLKQHKGIHKGKWNGIKLQPIAPLLYKYSCYLLRDDSAQLPCGKQFF